MWQRRSPFFVSYLLISSLFIGALQSPAALAEDYQAYRWSKAWGMVQENSALTSIFFKRGGDVRAFTAIGAAASFFAFSALFIRAWGVQADKETNVDTAVLVPFFVFLTLLAILIPGAYIVQQSDSALMMILSSAEVRAGILREEMRLGRELSKRDFHNYIYSESAKFGRKFCAARHPPALFVDLYPDQKIGSMGAVPTELAIQSPHIESCKCHPRAAEEARADGPPRFVRHTRQKYEAFAADQEEADRHRPLFQRPNLIKTATDFFRGESDTLYYPHIVTRKVVCKPDPAIAFAPPAVTAGPSTVIVRLPVALRPGQFVRVEGAPGAVEVHAPPAEVIQAAPTQGDRYVGSVFFPPLPMPVSELVASAPVRTESVRRVPALRGRAQRASAPVPPFYGVARAAPGALAPPPWPSPYYDPSSAPVAYSDARVGASPQDYANPAIWVPPVGWEDGVDGDIEP